MFSLFVWNESTQAYWTSLLGSIKLQLLARNMDYKSEIKGGGVNEGKGSEDYNGVGNHCFYSCNAPDDC